MSMSTMPTACAQSRGILPGRPSTSMTWAGATSMRRRSSKGVSVLLIILALAIPIDASLSMNGVLIPEQAVPGALRQLAGSFEEKQVSSTVYIYANGQRVAKRVNGEMFYFHNDHLGSAAVVTDSQGNIVEEKRYDPFGMELAGSGKIGYNSKELDRDTELNYYGARYYTADFGRFTTPDTVKGQLENPQSLNLYAYTLNNPMKYVDPSGNQYEHPMRTRMAVYGVNVLSGGLVGGFGSMKNGWNFWSGFVKGALGGSIASAG